MAPRYAVPEKKKADPSEQTKKSLVYSKGTAQVQSSNEALRPQLLLTVCLLENMVRPDESDLGYQIVKRNSGSLGKDFVDFRAAESVMPLPPKGTGKRKRLLEKLRNFVLDNEEEPEYVYKDGEVQTPRSFVDINISEDQGYVKFTNLYFLPPGLDEDTRFKISTLIRAILQNNENGVATALGCWNVLKKSARERDGCYAAAIEQESLGNVEMAEKLRELTKTYDSMILEMKSRLQILARSEEIPDASIAHGSRIEKSIGRLSKQIAHSMEARFLDAFSGKTLAQKIERGKKMGLYSQMELAVYDNIMAEINLHLKKVKSFSTRAGGNLLSGGLDDLPELESSFRNAMNLVSNLESLAWKIDLYDYKMRLRARGGYKGIRTASTVIPDLLRSSQYVVNAQLTHSSKAELARIKERAVDSCEILKSFVTSLGKAPTGEEAILTKEHVRRYSGRIDAQLKKLKASHLLDEFAGISKELRLIGIDLNDIIAERRQLLKAKDGKNPWHVQAASYVKYYTVKHYLTVLGVTTATGAVIGGVGGYLSPAPTGAAAGAAAGAKAGYNTGSLIIAAAGAFMTSEALYRYFSETGSTEEALEDLKLGSTFLLFGVGGAPIKMLSAPVKMIAGAGTAAANVPLLYEHIKQKNYWEIPSDVVYIAVGGTVFVRTLSGAFRAIQLKKAVNAIAFGNASGSVALTAKLAAKATRAAALPEIIASSAHAGYSPFMVGLNTVFAALSRPYDIIRKIDNKDYSGALSVLGGHFATITREMVTFEFALIGLGAAFRTTIRLKAPVSQARFMKFIYEDGLFEKIVAIAKRNKVTVQDWQIVQQLVDMAFMSEGKVSANYVKEVLGMKSLRDATAISREIAESWHIGRAVFAEGKRMAGLPVARRRWNVKRWKKVKARMQKTYRERLRSLKLRHLKLPVLVGGIGYLQAKDIARQKREYEIGQITTNHEMRFIDRMRIAPPVEFMKKRVTEDSLIEAMGVIDDVQSAYVDSPFYRGTETKKRLQKKILFSCTLGILMNGEKVTSKRLSKVFENVQLATDKAGIPVTAYTRVDTLALIASLVVRTDKVYSFVNNYNSISLGREKRPQPFTDYAVAAVYVSTYMGTSLGWARESSTAIFDSFRKRKMEKEVLGWKLLSVYSILSSHDFSKEPLKSKKIRAALATSNMRDSFMSITPEEVE